MLYFLEQYHGYTLSPSFPISESSVKLPLRQVSTGMRNLPLHRSLFNDV